LLALLFLIFFVITRGLVFLILVLSVIIIGVVVIVARLVFVVLVVFGVLRLLLALLLFIIFLIAGLGLVVFTREIHDLSISKDVLLGDLHPLEVTIAVNADEVVLNGRIITLEGEDETGLGFVITFADSQGDELLVGEFAVNELGGELG